MIRSMTGFGRAEVNGDGLVVRAEVRSVNHRDLQVTCRVPDAFHPREAALQKQLGKGIRRGHLYLWLTCEQDRAEREFEVDEDVVRGYIQQIKRLASEEGIEPNIELGGLLRMPGAMRQPARAQDMGEAAWPYVEEAVAAAREALVQMRGVEGANLSEQLTDLVAEIERRVAVVESEQGKFVPRYRDRLHERIAKLLAGTGIAPSEEALAREVAMQADRCDVSEEIARLRSHVEQFRAALADDDAKPVGRKMEFLGQEMLREAGTIAAKVPSGPQVEQVLEIRTQVERLREQVRNVE